jgi:hypothetical protein
MTAARAIGLILVIAGGVLGVWFAQSVAAPGPAAAPAFVVAAIALAMVSVGARYLLRRRR